MKQNKIQHVLGLHHIICVMIVVLSLSTHLEIVIGEVVHITVLTTGQAGIETSEALYQCYRSEPDLNATLAFGRTAPIPSATAPDPPADQQHSDASPNIRVVTFTDSSWDTDGYGPFYCQGSKPGRDLTQVSALFLRGDAKFAQSDGVFTGTVNVGDVGVTISMTALAQPDSAGNVVEWRKNGGVEHNVGVLSYQFAGPIQADDEGIYEIYYLTERSLGRGSLFRLLVRECPAGKWGLPNCLGICDKCYNGGICDDRSGFCICPNNFRGPNCLNICRSDGGNRFGLDCEFQCSYLNDDADKCRRKMFCLPDPYGCSCDAGFKGLDCTQDCDNGTYGAGCTQTCHCASGVACNKYSGICPRNCETGWSGDNCQIPDVCAEGYYGDNCTSKCHCLSDAPCDKISGECTNYECAPGYDVYDGQDFCEECRGAVYGPGCMDQCYCSEEACDKVTGICDGQCLPQWLYPDCKYGITRVIQIDKVNPFETSSFVCYVTGNITFPAAIGVGLYRVVENTWENNGIVEDRRVVESGELAVVFTVRSVYVGEYACTHTHNGNDTYLQTTAETYTLPALQEVPAVSTILASAVKLNWSHWSPDEDIGDPPIVGYTLFHFDLSSGNKVWIEDTTVGPFVDFGTVTDLDPETEYEFSVSAVREGPGGTGPRSPSASAITLCGNPNGFPTSITATADQTRQLSLSWQNPADVEARCTTGYSHHMIYYSPLATPDDPTAVQISNVSRTTHILTDLEVYSEYTIYMTSSNKDAESRSSTVITQTSLEEIAPPPVNLIVSSGPTVTSLNLSWSTANPRNLNGNIKKFQVFYSRVVDKTQLSIKDVAETSYDVDFILEFLQSNTTYSIQVRTVNGAGTSEQSETGEASTGVETVVPTESELIPSVLPWALCGFFLAVNIVCGGVFLILRCRNGGTSRDATRLASARAPLGLKRVPSQREETQLHVYEDPADYRPQQGDVVAETGGPRYGNINEGAYLEPVVHQRDHAGGSQSTL